MYEYALALLRISTLFGVFPFKYHLAEGRDGYFIPEKRKDYPFKYTERRLIFGLPFLGVCIWRSYMGFKLIPFIPQEMFYTKYRTLVNSFSALITSMCLLLSIFGNKQFKYCLNESYMLILESNLKHQHFWYNPIIFITLILILHLLKLFYLMVMMPHAYLSVIMGHVSNYPPNFIQYTVLFMATTAEISFHNLNERLSRMKKYKIREESIVSQMEQHWRVVDFVETFNNALGARLLAMLTKTLMIKFFVFFTIILHYVPNTAFKKSDLPTYAFIDWVESSILSFGIIIYTSYCSNKLFSKSKHTLFHLRELSFNNILTEKADVVISIFANQIQRRDCYISAGNVINYKMSLVLTITSSTLVYAVTWCQFIVNS